MRRLTGSAAIALAVLAALASTAKGAWTAPETIGGAPWTAAPAVGIDAAGNATLLVVGDADGTGPLLSADRPTGGAWTAATEVPGVTGAQQPGTLGTVALEVGASGAAVALWREGAAYRTAHRAAFGQPWTVETVPPVPDGSGFAPRIAIDADGDALIAWVEVDEAPEPDVDRVMAARRTPAGPWGAAEQVAAKDRTGTDGLQLFDVAFSGDGLPAVLYADEVTRRATVRFRGAGPWGDDLALPAQTGWDVGVFSPSFTGDLETGAGGGVVALWKEFNLGTSHERVRAAAASGTGTFGAAQTLVDQEYTFSTLEQLRLATTSAGEALAAFRDGDDGSIWAARRPAGGAFEPAAPLTTNASDAFEPAIGPGGVRVVAWFTGGQGNAARTAPGASGPWAAAEPLHPPISDEYRPWRLTVAGSAAGVVAGWSADIGPDIRPQATLLAGAPPDDDDGGSGGGGSGGGGSGGGGSGGGGSPTPQPTPVVPAPTPTATGARSATLGRARASCAKVRRRGRCRIRLRFTLDRPATVKVTVAKLVKGKRRRLGSLRRRVRGPQARLTLPARVGRRTLGTGVYVLTLEAAGNRPQTLRARIR